MPLICAIHQPNFFPWLGYFDKIRRADRFVFLDAVSYPRSGSGGMGSWTNRVMLNIGGNKQWVGCPLKRAAAGALIQDIAIDDAQPWRAKLLKTLDANYRRAVNFQTVMTFLQPLILEPESRLADFNIRAVTAISDRLGLTTAFLRQSELPHQGRATSLLISLTKAAGADVYLAGGGAGGYQEDDAFGAEVGVRLRYQDFAPAVYGPKERFMPGLSVIDYLMHDGRPLHEAFANGG